MYIIIVEYPFRRVKECTMLSFFQLNQMMMYPVDFLMTNNITSISNSHY